MSRVGKKPILIPEGVEVKIEGEEIIVKGPLGELRKKIQPEIKVAFEEGKIFLTPQEKTLKRNQSVNRQAKEVKMLWGLTRALLNNMVRGVKEGFEKKLEIEGLGFLAKVVDDGLELSVGFTHPVKIKASEGIKFSVEKNIITVAGIDLGKVSQVAAQIKRARPAEPYKGKGIKYLGEHIRRKEVKKAAAAAAT